MLIGKLITIEVGIVYIIQYCFYEKLRFYMNAGNHGTVSEKNLVSVL